MCKEADESGVVAGRDVGSGLVLLGIVMLLRGAERKVCETKRLYSYEDVRCL